MSWLRARYGAGPAHLLGFLVSLLVAALAMSRFFQSDQPDKVFLWFFGAILVHDLLFLPLYSLPGRVLSREPASVRPRARLARVRLYVRVPALLSGLLLLVFYPLILRRSEGDYNMASGLTQAPYLHRWLLATAILFALSAVAFLFSTLRRR
jgi:hypothetical protein